MAFISSTPILGNAEATIQNLRLFRQLKELIQQKNLVRTVNIDID